MTTPGLVVTDLAGGPGGKEIVTSVSVTVGPGEVHALMGPNGSGKSTLGHLLLGRPGYTVTRGTATLAGRDLLALPTHERARAGLFLGFQYPVEVPGVPMRVFLAEAAAASGTAVQPQALLTDVEPVALALEEEPGDLLDRDVNVGLSGGERKKSEVVQLATLRPKIAILDEIDSGLDIDAVRAVARQVRSLADTGIGIVLITHYQRILLAIEPDHVHVLIGGRIVESGGPALAAQLEAGGYELYGPGTDDAAPHADPGTPFDV